MIGETWLIEEVKADNCHGCVYFDDAKYGCKISKAICGRHSTNQGSKFTKRKVKHFDLTPEDISILSMAKWYVELGNQFLIKVASNWDDEFCNQLAKIMFYYEVTGQK